jgi:Tfp pilus assembly major pilin PilA
MKRTMVLAALVSAAVLLGSCSNSSDSSSDKKADVAVTTKATSQVIAKLKSALMGDKTSQSVRSSRAVQEDHYTDTFTDTSELGGSFTAVNDIYFTFDDVTYEGSQRGTCTITFTDYKMDIDGVTYTIGGKIISTMSGTFEKYTDTEKGTVTIDGESVDVDITNTTTTTYAEDDSGWTDTTVTTGSLGGEPVNETHTYTYKFSDFSSDADVPDDTETVD